MSALKLQVGRALRVIPSDNNNIPFPASNSSGTNTEAIANRLVDNTATFITRVVKAGDIVYNETDGTATTVASVESEISLTLSNNIFTATGKSYTIYDSGSVNNGCVLYIGGQGDIKVVTEGGDTITFNSLNEGTFVPVNVIKVFSTGTTATLINALW